MPRLRPIGTIEHGFEHFEEVLVVGEVVAPDLAPTVIAHFRAS
ncbi:hypothetical protein Rhow_004982 [Rhodococcus wratislaviensis]|uniref:Uncharacterized protein n=1 Tax=Rhodococcus wratislaviensis TaxID=44752 RepID=A0A402CCP0_RHOWR|nr:MULTISPECIES: hypothetical protein [Rhodococcus]GCE41323.1 hypothetical protein Rhow_004982 [Rhodococcus wratislaviensis]